MSGLCIVCMTKKTTSRYWLELISDWQIFLTLMWTGSSLHCVLLPNYCCYILLFFLICINTFCLIPSSWCKLCPEVSLNINYFIPDVNITKKHVNALLIFLCVCLCVCVCVCVSVCVWCTHIHTSDKHYVTGYTHPWTWVYLMCTWTRIQLF